MPSLKQQGFNPFHSTRQPTRERADILRIKIDTETDLLEAQLQDKEKNYLNKIKRVSNNRLAIKQTQSTYQNLYKKWQENPEKLKLKQTLIHYDQDMAFCTAELKHCEEIQTELDHNKNLNQAVNKLKQKEYALQLLEKEQKQKEEESNQSIIPSSDIKKLREFDKVSAETWFKQRLRIARYGYSLSAKIAKLTATSKTSQIALDVVSTIAFPVRLAITGAKAGWDVYFAWRDKTLGQRKTRIVTGLINLVTIALIAALMSTPLGFSIITITSMVTGLYKESYITSCLRKAIAQEQRELKHDQEKLDRLTQSQTNPIARDIKIAGLKKQIEARADHLTRLKAKRLEAQAKVAYYAAGVLGATLILIGLFFPPLAIAGAALLVLNSAAYTADKHTTPVNGIARWFSTGWDKIRGKQSITPPAPTSSPSALLNKPSPTPAVKQYSNEYQSDRSPGRPSSYSDTKWSSRLHAASGLAKAEPPSGLIGEYKRISSP